jgi:superfamily II DNA/RNA helicase
MKIIDLGHTGEPFTEKVPGWDNVGLSSKWKGLVEEIAPGSRPHDIQVQVLRDCNLLGSRRNLVVSSPTNSGKSLLGYFAILAGLAERRRALLLEPFRAIAQEKHDELSALLPRIEQVLRRSPRIEITTGDYRLNGETLLADPPESGELVIATPERIEAIMRNQDFDSWLSSFGVVCVDEAHLIGDPKRGPSLEYVITRFLSENSPPRFVLLSATLGASGALESWLDPCDAAHSKIRRPELYQQVLVVEEEEKADEIVLREVGEALREPDASVLVFVYRTGDASRLAAQLSESLRSEYGGGVAAAYHSKMPAAQKKEVKESYETGKTLCLVSTTALGAGVNLPATHVIIRDMTFGRDGALPIRDLLQMMGRAGRGNRSGKACVILKPKDTWKQEALVEKLRNPELPELKSALLVEARHGEGNPLARFLLGQLVRHESQTLEELQDFLSHSLGGKGIGERAVEDALSWLSDSQRVLTWKSEKGFEATSLGKAVTRAGIPLEVGAGIASLIRDIFSTDEEDKLLADWKPLDTLLVLELLDPRERALKRFSKALPEQVEAWIEAGSAKSTLFTQWIRGAPGSSKAVEVLGSLGVSEAGKPLSEEKARQYAYLATMRAIIIHQLGSGVRVEDVGRRWGVTGLDGVEERWRDHLLWQLAGVAEILNVPCFYFHLKEECKAETDRVTRIEKCFKGCVHGIFELMGLLRFCSPLGPFFRDLEASKVGLGVRTKKKLEDAGVLAFAQIQRMTFDDLQEIGIRKDLGQKLKDYVRRRSA